ncbi:hypothetical protein FRB90_003151 [Tulasnella sp. 427]|nr:hypothetical protein FRB90_003151 [Tulasnella sp. 427]
MDSDILQSTFNELNHLVIPPSELAIEEDVELGVGAYGEVFFATLNRNSTSVKVAVKQLRIAQAKGVRRRIAIRLARELKVWARASHPNILALVGFYVSDNYSCAQLVSPLMSNGNVKNYVEAHQPSLATRLHLSNVVVNDSIEAVLCDFGLANFVLESGATTGLSTTSVKGCARYMSPELFSNEAAKHILESDIWAWACTAFEIVTDVHPFHLLKTDGAVILALLQGKPPGSSSLLGSLALGAHVSCPMGQDTLESVITGCWGMDPEYRPRSSDIKHRMASITSVDGVPDLTGQIKKDISILKQGGKFCDVYVGYHEGSEPSGPSLVALRLPNKKYDAEVSERYGYGIA